MKKTGHAGKGHTSKHVGTSKHHARTSKHHPSKLPGGWKIHQPGPPAAHVKAKHPSHAKGLALGDELPVCTVEALAMSLRLLGQPVSEDEVAWLWEMAGGRELEIAEALEAAARFGLAGLKPRRMPVAHPLVAGSLVFAQPEFPGTPQVVFGAADEALHAVILGVDVPGPHAVLATPDGWWSWGELWSPWTRQVSEAWAVSWS